MARQQVETVDFATSNVRGAPFQLYIAGARIEANYPIGPTGGTALNLTLMSYDGSLDMGLNVDPGAVDDPDGAAGRDRGRASPRLLAVAGAESLGADRASSTQARAGVVQLRRREQHAHVEEQVGDLVGGHELAVHEVGEPGVDEAQGLVDHRLVGPWRRRPVLVVTSSVSVIAARIPTRSA